MISNLKKYNQFLCINNKTITICKDKITNPKVIKIIDTEKIIQEILYNKLIYNLIIEYEYKKIRLLHTSFSVFGFICYIGPFITLLILKSSNNKAHKVNEIYQVLPELFKSAPRKPSKAEDIIIDFLTWCFVLFISYLGLFGILDTLLLAYNYLRN